MSVLLATGGVAAGGTLAAGAEGTPREGDEKGEVVAVGDSPGAVGD